MSDSVEQHGRANTPAWLVAGVALAAGLGIGVQVDRTADPAPAPATIVEVKPERAGGDFDFGVGDTIGDAAAHAVCGQRLRALRDRIVEARVEE